MSDLVPIKQRIKNKIYMKNGIMRLWNGTCLLCPHNKRTYNCIICNPNAYCSCKKRKHQCVACNGKYICIHKRRKWNCIQCNGTSICPHKKRKNICSICNVNGYLAHIYRNRIYSVFQYKPGKSITYLGCSIQTFKTHLENKFLPGMSWENKGLWHIDHIRPCASFDLSKEDELKKCFHYTNMQPLWAEDNLRKGSKYSIPE